MVKNSFSAPWVNFSSELAAECADTPTTILTAPTACVIDEVAFTNVTGNNIFVSLTVTRNTGSPYSILLINYQNIDRYNTGWFLEGKNIYLEPGDAISVFSDSPTNIFDCLLSYRQLNQLTS